MKRTILSSIVFSVIVLCILPDLFAQSANRQQKDSLWSAISSAEGKEKIDLCKQLIPLYTTEVRSDDYVIDTIFHLSDLMEAEKCLRECIELLKDSTSYLHVLSGVYYNLGINLVAQRRYDDALEIAAQTEEINRQYEEASKSSQPGAWSNLWNVYKDAYMQSGEYDKAEIYINKLDSISKGSFNFSKNNTVSVLRNTGK